jgi:hypothetical protein
MHTLREGSVVLSCLVARMGALRLCVSSAAAAIMFGLCLLGPALAQGGPHTLALTGASLGTLESDGELDDLRMTVNPGGDTVVATHVWAVIGGSELRQRTANGYWVPWSGATADLIDNGFEIKNGVIEFKLVDGSIVADNQGITFVIGYRAGGTLKYGTLGVVPNIGGGS